MKVVTFDDIKQLNIPPETCYSWVCEMIGGKRETELPAKISMHPSEGAFCNVMPCIIPSDALGKAGGVKIVNRYPDRVPSLDSKLLLVDMNSGEFLALMDANWITAMRTGAVCAHSVQLLAKKDFHAIAMLGLGNTARASLLILASIFKDRELNIKLLPYKGQEKIFAERFKDFPNIYFTYAENEEELVRGADVIISCVTYFAKDLCGDECFDEGCLVVPVHTRGFTNCDLFFDKVYADDTAHVCHFKNFDKFKSFAEINDVVNGRVPGRENDKERILAYNIGLAIHDLNYADHIYQILKDKPNILDITLGEPTSKFWL